MVGIKGVLGHQIFYTIFDAFIRIIISIFYFWEVISLFMLIFINVVLLIMIPIIKKKFQASCKNYFPAMSVSGISFILVVLVYYRLMFSWPSIRRNIFIIILALAYMLYLFYEYIDSDYVKKNNSVEPIYKFSIKYIIFDFLLRTILFLMLKSDYQPLFISWFCFIFINVTITFIIFFMIGADGIGIENIGTFASIAILIISIFISVMAFNLMHNLAVFLRLLISILFFPIFLFYLYMVATRSGVARKSKSSGILTIENYFGKEHKFR